MRLRIHFVVDPQGWFCMGLLIVVWLYNSLLIPKIILFPHYEEGHISAAAILCYYLFSLFCMASLLRASVADPGSLPESPQIPITEKDSWELCNKCNMMRPKRSHHCSRCGHCVRRMDHHCPWINNCVGEDNHWLFLQLCFYTELLSSYTLLLDFSHYYYFEPLRKVNADVFVFRHELALTRISTFTGLIMLVGITGLFYTQLIGVFNDITSIEKLANCCEEMYMAYNVQSTMGVKSIPILNGTHSPSRLNLLCSTGDLAHLVYHHFCLNSSVCWVYVKPPYCAICKASWDK